MTIYKEGPKTKGYEFLNQDIYSNPQFVEAVKKYAESDGGLAGTQYLYVAGNGTPTENGDELKAAYTLAQTMSPTSTNRVTVIVAPGKYFAFNHQFEFSTDYIDVVSLTGEADVFLSGISVGGICYIKGMNTTQAVSLGGTQPGFNLTSSPSAQKIENCVGGDYSFGAGGNVHGTFINCIGGDYSFGSNIKFSTFPAGITDLGLGDISGIFIDCFGGIGSFGAYFFQGNNITGTFTNCTSTAGISFGGSQYGAGNIIISGLFNNCKSGASGFGFSSNCVLAGTFINCQASDYSFGFFSGADASGIFTYCSAGIQSFGGLGGIASGTFTNCIAGAESFGTGTASGTFTNCIGGDNSFGSGTGTFTNCIGGTTSFGGTNLADGTYMYCVGGLNSFGTNMGPSISGKLYYCRLTSGSFNTVTGAGITRLCIDGSNVENNQG